MHLQEGRFLRGSSNKEYTSFKALPDTAGIISAEVFGAPSLVFFDGFFKELEIKELEIHGYSLLDIHQWIFIDGYPSISMNSLMDIHQ